MKLLLQIIIMLLLTTVVYSQNRMNVHSHNGSVTTFMMSEIDSITYTVDDGLFTCGNSTVTYFGKTYNTVQIGTQCWFKENLDVGTMVVSDGSHTGQQQTDNSTIEKYCYDNLESNCDTYGGLYEWNEAMQYITTEGTQGICPTGWHLPTYTEMLTLEAYASDRSSKLIDQSQTMGNNETATNTTGFSALLAGTRNCYTGSFYYGDGDRTSFWSSTENGSSAYDMTLFYDNSSVTFYSHFVKNYGFSIRCLKN